MNRGIITLKAKWYEWWDSHAKRGRACLLGMTGKMPVPSAILIWGLREIASGFRPRNENEPTVK